MNISFDKFEQFEAPILTLCNPNSEATIKDGKVTLSHTLGMLPGCKKVVLSPNFNAQWELSFEFPDSKNEQLHYMYKRLEKGRYIYVSDVGYFMIDDYTRHESEERVYKEISCRSVDKEIERSECPLLDEGSYYFFTKENDDGTVTEGIIQKQMTLLPKWTLGFVSDDLKEKSAYFDGENKSDNAYDFLWEEIEEAYECVIDVDLISRKLNFYSLEYYAAHHKTDIHLSKSNDLKEVVIESKDDDCFTAITVKQNDNLSLVYSNPNGSETLYNFTHYFSDMSPELQTALTKWQEKYEVTILPYRTLSEQWANALDDLANAEKDLDILKKELNNLKIDRDTVINTTASEETKQANLNTVNANISAKEQAISAQENVIATKKENIKTTYEEPLQAYANECSLSLTAKDTSGNLIFTQDLLNELSAYINPAEYSDDYIVQTDDMKYTEIYQQSNKLFDRAKRELEKLSTQSYTFSVENNSFLFNKKFERFSKQLMPGAIVYLETSNDTMEQVHLTNFSIDYDDCSVSFTFGNKYDENDLKSLFDDVFGSVKTSAVQIKYLKNIINDQRSLLEKQKDWIDNALTLTKEHALTSSHQTVVIDDSGYWGKKILFDKDGNAQYDTGGNLLYENEQLKIINNGVYLTTDNWNNLATAVGKIYLYHDEENDTDVFKYGVAGDLIIGKMFLGKELSLIASPRSDGTYAITLNQNGLTVINDGTSAGITIKDAAGNKQFYADSDGNLCLSGNINAIGGKIGGYTIDEHFLYNHTDYGSAGIAEYPYGWAFWAGTDNGDHTGENAEFKVGHDGSLCAKKGTVAGWNINASEICKMSGGRGTGLQCPDSGAIALSIGYTDQNSWSTAPFYVTHEGYMVAKSGTIAGWNISDSRIYNTSSKGCTVSLWNPGIAGGDIINANIGDYYPFRVDINGKLYAKDADIEGHINATSGSFTGTIEAAEINGSTINIGSRLGNLNVVNGDKYGTKFSHYNGEDYGALDLSYLACSLTCVNHGRSGKDASVVVQNDKRGYLQGTWAYWDGSSGSLSDKSTKTDIVSFTDPYDNLFDNLQPCLYKYIDGASGRKHFGFIAQDTEEAILKSGLTQKDVAFIIDMERDKDDGTKDKKKFLRYEEFIALNTWQIQKLKAKVQELESKITALS